MRYKIVISKLIDSGVASVQTYPLLLNWTVIFGYSLMYNLQNSSILFGEGSLPLKQNQQGSNFPAWISTVLNEGPIKKIKKWTRI